MSALAKLFAMVIFGCIGLSMFWTFIFSRPNNPLTYYDLLGLETVQPTTDQISQTYRKLVRRLHPDLLVRLSDEERAKLPPYTLEEINQAYQVLSKPTKRIRYDFSLSQPGHFHQDTHFSSQEDRISRVYQYQTSWDDHRGSFGSIDNILIGYSLKFPEQAKFAKQIYQSDGDDSALSEAAIKPYILVKSIGYDNIISYHFSDFTDQLDRPRQLLINIATVIFSLICGLSPLWFMCSSSKGSEEELLTNEDKAKLAQFERAGWSFEDVEKQRQTMVEKSQAAIDNKRAYGVIKQKARELNRQNKLVQDGINKENKLKQDEGKKKELAKTAKKIQAKKALRAEAPVEIIAPTPVETNPFFCEACRKKFNTKSQYKQHIDSNQHKKSIKEMANSQ